MNESNCNPILVCMDNTDLDAVRLAARIARQSNATIRLVCFMPDPPLYRTLAVPNYAELAELARSAKHAQLSKIARRLTARGIPTDCAVLHGEDQTEIVREMERQCASLVILPAESSEDGFHAGRSALFLMRNAPAPVLVVRPGVPKRSPRVLAALDLDADRDDELNGLILSQARQLAASLSGDLHVLHVWSAYGESMLRRSTFASIEADELEQYLKQSALQQQNSLRALLDRCACQIPEANCHLSKGNPVEEIPRFCRSHRIDVLVMGTVARKGLLGALLGNTAERIAHHLPASVVTVKPAAPGHLP